MTPTDLSDLPDDDLEALRSTVIAEQERRQKLVSIPAAITSLTEEFVSLGGDLADLEEAAISSKHII